MESDRASEKDKEMIEDSEIHEDDPADKEADQS